MPGSLRIALVALAALALLVCDGGWALADEPLRRVLVLLSERRELPGNALFEESLRAALASALNGSVEIYSESLDVSRFSSPGDRQAQVDFLRRRYADKKLDLVISVGEPALEVVARYGGQLFPATPIVASAAPQQSVAALPPTITSVIPRVQMRTTFEVALRLHPNTRRAVVVAGTSPYDRIHAARARRELQDMAPGLEIAELGEGPMARVLEAAAAQPRDTVIFYLHILRDGDGRQIVPSDGLARIASVANAPIYGLYETYLGHGIVGGHVYSFSAAAQQVADVAVDVLRGERPGDGGPLTPDTNVYAFDWRQLTRWGIDERLLPAGSIVRYRERSMWDLYRGYIVGGAAALVLQAALIVGLLANRAQRRRAQRALRERLRFETLVSDLSASFITLPVHEIDGELEKALRRIVEDLDIDRASLATIDGRRRDTIVLTHSWAREGVDRVGRSLEVKEFPWIGARLRAGETVAVSRLSELPDEAETDRRAFAGHATRSFAAIPLMVEGSPIGALAFSTTRGERAWADELVQRLRLVADVFANALARRRAASAARESEDRFRLLADTAPLMIWMTGHDGRRTYFNRRWLDMTGRQADEDVGEAWIETVHPDDRALTAELYRVAVAERRSFTIDYRLRRRDGEDRWILDHGVPRIAEDGAFAGYVGSIIDITALNTALRAVLESNALRSAIFGSLYGQVMAIDRQGVILAVNQAWTSLQEEAGADSGCVSVGVNYLDVCLRAVAGGDATAEQALQAVNAVLLGESNGTRLEYACQTPSGERWFEMAIEPFHRPDGGAVISYIDITRRRQAEEEARRQREELAHALRVTTLGELSASFAHEINQPLAAIVTNAQATVRLLKRRGIEHADVFEALTDIAADARRASEIIRRLRALSRKEHAPQTGLDLNALVDDVVSLLRHELSRRNITVVRVSDPFVPPIAGDPVQLQQVLMNLVVNATEAIDRGGDTGRRIVITTSHRPPDVVEIAVRDSGVGVRQAELERMFERFVSSKPGGLGMGLSISRSIVEAHGGRIRAAVNPDQGLTLYVELVCESGTPSAGRVAHAPGVLG
jgi:two-component system, LuxR family, sensor kinase FixL